MPKEAAEHLGHDEAVKVLTPEESGTITTSGISQAMITIREMRVTSRGQIKNEPGF